MFPKNLSVYTFDTQVLCFVQIIAFQYTKLESMFKGCTKSEVCKINFHCHISCICIPFDYCKGNIVEAESIFALLHNTHHYQLLQSTCI
jgi:hypothetical protein